MSAWGRVEEARRWGRKRWRERKEKRMIREIPSATNRKIYSSIHTLESTPTHTYTHETQKKKKREREVSNQFRSYQSRFGGGGGGANRFIVARHDLALLGGQANLSTSVTCV